MKNDYIKNYLLYETRNKVILHNELIDDVKYLDLGICLSELIKNKVTSKNISLIAKEELNKLIENNCFEHPFFGKINAIKNIGILMEEGIKLDFINFLENHSKLVPLFIEWRGEYDNKQAYFLTKQKGKKFNLSQINHIFI